MIAYYIPSIKTSLIFSLCLFPMIAIYAINDTIYNKKKLTLSGFIKYDAFFDSRQVAGARENYLALYPKNIDMDANGEDINKRNSFHFISIHSRLGLDFPSFQTLNAHVSSHLEVDFLGNENQFFTDLNGLRLRHAYIKFNWKTTELIIGQYWHPFFVRKTSPKVISINTGIPFQPLSRNPQIRITKMMGSFGLTVLAYSQIDFPSTGPNGVSSEYIRNSGIPNFHFRGHYENDSSTVFAGIGIDYKVIAPELFTEANGQRFSSSSEVKSLSAMGFLGLDFKKVNNRTACVLAGNAYDMLMLGGYAALAPSNTNTGVRDFTNIGTFSAWNDFTTSHKMLEFGLFTGYSKNLGVDEVTGGDLYSRGSNISYVYRFSPRTTIKFKNLSASLEYEYTVAGYGDPAYDTVGYVTNAAAVANSRILLSTRYNF